MRHYGQTLKDLLKSMERSKRRRVAKEELHTKLKTKAPSIKPRLGDKFWSFIVDVSASPKQGRQNRSGTAGFYEDGDDIGKSCVAFCME